MRKGDYVEVNEKGNGYFYSRAGSLGRVVRKKGNYRVVRFEWVTYKSDIALPIDLDIHPNDLTVIPKEIYDIKLKAYQV